ncbi:hypothetical protein OVA11_14260 [Caulobacter sp. SL161]|uniref:hypothetical protein n=1 Tax=Caulobacter sp. SL161 TaxID=2995156 RepID=UPI00227617AC|nr:hypothetical protein [Caulobacter sp. SL161]MCY1648184.1 hypothetical protein [Caulobacter sp. SL161]
MSVKFDFKSLDEAFECAWPVSIPVPQPGGSVQAQEITAIFKILSPEEADAANNQLTADNPWAWFNAWWVGLEGEDLTPELRDKMLRRPYVRAALTNAYQNFVQGIPAKN